jgi:hypothetical protein
MHNDPLKGDNSRRCSDRSNKADTEKEIASATFIFLSIEHNTSREQ